MFYVFVLAEGKPRDRTNPPGRGFSAEESQNALMAGINRSPSEPQAKRAPEDGPQIRNNRRMRCSVSRFAAADPLQR